MSLYSPSLKKTQRSRSPRRKSTPSRLYLRQAFPTLGSAAASDLESSTVSQISPDVLFRRRQQLLHDAQNEVQETDGIDRQKGYALGKQQQQQKVTNSIHVRTPLSSIPSNTDTHDAKDAKDAKDVQETLARFLNQKSLSSSLTSSASGLRPIPSDNVSQSYTPSVPRLRTTETEYDQSPTRFTRLSTPPRGVPSTSPAKSLQEQGIFTRQGFASALAEQWQQRRHEDIEQLGNLNRPLSPFISSSPLNQHLRSRQKYLEQDQRFSMNKYDDDTMLRAQKRYESELRSTHDNGKVCLEGKRPSNAGAEYIDTQAEESAQEDQEYAYGDEEVSFRRPKLISTSSDQSTLVDRLHSSEDKPVSLSSVQTPPAASKFVARSGSWAKLEAESSLLEVAERTAAITEELRGVYNNLQELFSPETEAKLNRGKSVLSAQKDIGYDHINNDFQSSVPKPPVFKKSPASVKVASPIKKSKPAPLRPALKPKQHQPSPSESPNQQKWRQGQHQQNSQESSSSKPNKADDAYRHNIILRWLISDAESARRIRQMNGSIDLNSITPDVAEISTPSSNDIKETDTDTNDKHQEQFHRKLNRWKRVEKQSQDLASSLPDLYSDLHIPTVSSRQETPFNNDLSWVNDYNQESDVGHYDDQGYSEVLTEVEVQKRQHHDKDRYPNSNPTELQDKLSQEILAEMAREEELRAMRGKRPQHEMTQLNGHVDPEDLAVDGQRLSKKRKEAVFWMS
ncbi:hypothetical protein BCR41DRAFT_386749 [Lobosporangium transversale]|uniref:Uncharacterized protein n=1 Tax=Lobosporangium transversale TaxID=64571 RepID=A0A1Y2GLQ6_9FUNG|nr:hypothetical protein BCR41DRAFT_386749 [Lobosporangium transversale]ORZ14904.1 hypothetical protein BCR41DRAFT_386749 [Lobosporangium transversale]|eukprot:XP_021881036.1 hypothetical protein BCR41DRAFT_386749 [Lobosporangium transversale]